MELILTPLIEQIMERKNQVRRQVDWISSK